MTLVTSTTVELAADRACRFSPAETGRFATDDMPLTKKGKSPARLPFKVFRNDGGRTCRTTFLSSTSTKPLIRHEKNACFQND
jgi:hypothetical protein